MYNIKRNYRLLLSINNNLSKQYVKQLFSLLPRLWIAMNILISYQTTLIFWYTTIIIFTNEYFIFKGFGFCIFVSFVKYFSDSRTLINKVKEHVANNHTLAGHNLNYISHWYIYFPVFNNAVVTLKH